LKLWKDRLNLAPEFVNDIDVTAKNYIHMETLYDDDIDLILFVKMRSRKTLMPTRIKMTQEIAKNLIEKIDIGDRSAS